MSNYNLPLAISPAAQRNRPWGPMTLAAISRPLVKILTSPTGDYNHSRFAVSLKANTIKSSIFKAWKTVYNIPNEDPWENISTSAKLFSRIFLKINTQRSSCSRNGYELPSYTQIRYFLRTVINMFGWKYRWITQSSLQFKIRLLLKTK